MLKPVLDSDKLLDEDAVVWSVMLVDLRRAKKLVREAMEDSRRREERRESGAASLELPCCRDMVHVRAWLLQIKMNLCRGRRMSPSEESLSGPYAPCGVPGSRQFRSQMPVQTIKMAKSKHKFLKMTSNRRNLSTR